MGFKTVFLIFLLWRLFDFLILFFSPHFIPYLGFFPYKEIFVDYHLPSWLTSLANFDGVHYLLIARQGYMQYEQAFFPLYPLLIKILTSIFNNGLAAGLIISNICFLAGLFLLTKIIGGEEKGIPAARSRGVYSKRALTGMNPRQNLLFLLLLILTFPTSFFFGAVYTEGLFFFLFIASLYFFTKDLPAGRQENYFLAAIFAFFASLARLIGVSLVIPFFFHFYKKRRQALINLTGWFWPIIGLLIYSFYLYRTTGDPLFFLTSQPIFGAHRSTNLIFLPQVYFRYLKIFFTASFNFQYFVSLFEFVVFNFVLIILILDLFKNLKLEIRNYFRLGLNLFSFANLLLPTLTGTFSSIPRYALLSLSFFIFLAEIKNAWLKTFIVLVFLILHIIILGFFGQGYFIG